MYFNSTVSKVSTNQLYNHRRDFVLLAEVIFPQQRRNERIERNVETERERRAFLWRKRYVHTHLIRPHHSVATKQGRAIGESKIPLPVRNGQAFRHSRGLVEGTKNKIMIQTNCFISLIPRPTVTLQLTTVWKPLTERWMLFTMI